MICKRCIVSGRVQGVFYRASAAIEARRLGVTGHAHNMPDGSVEVLALGEERAVATLVEWLAVGPSAAVVTGVDACDLPVPEDVPSHFTTG